MSQEELLSEIQQNPGIEQGEVVRSRKKQGHNGRQVTQLVKKGCIRREVFKRSFRLWPTGVEL